MRRFLLLYFLALTLPLFLGVSVRQAKRHAVLQRELGSLEVTQEEWIEDNKQLIAEITLLSSPERVGYIAAKELGLMKKQPEEILQIRIENGRRGIDG
ncbi:MAG: cell division protein FtsL [Treponema sp.]|jgi:cell division protein FtsL|nr:cell division protein FtsL [Treponema sp.]